MRSAQTSEVDFDTLAANDDFRYGIDLFNHGFAWEAHEMWEPLWRAAPRERAERAMLHGFVHAAAAIVKARSGRIDVARRFVARACKQLARATTSIVDGHALSAALIAWADDPARPAPAIALACSEQT